MHCNLVKKKKFPVREVYTQVHTSAHTHAYTHAHKNTHTKTHTLATISEKDAWPVCFQPREPAGEKPIFFFMFVFRYLGWDSFIFLLKHLNNNDLIKHYLTISKH